jgi:hypothetical protein
VNPPKVNAQRRLSRIFAIPLLLGLVSAAGLTAALVGDDIWDVIGWLGLGIPLAVTVWCLTRPKSA